MIGTCPSITNAMTCRHTLAQGSYKAGVHPFLALLSSPEGAVMHGLQGNDGGMCCQEGCRVKGEWSLHSTFQLRISRNQGDEGGQIKISSMQERAGGFMRLCDHCHNVVLTLHFFLRFPEAMSHSSFQLVIPACLGLSHPLLHPAGYLSPNSFKVLLNSAFAFQ